MKKSILIILLLGIALTGILYGQEADERVSVGIQPLVLSGDRDIALSVADAISGTLRLSLILMGRYIVLEPEQDEWRDVESLQDAADVFGMDNIITGKVTVGEGDYAAVIEVAVYSRAEQEIVLSEKVEISSFLDIFDATDELTLTLLEGFTEGPLTIGSLTLLNTGPNRSYFVEIGGEVVGEQLMDISPLPAGFLDVRIYEIIRFREYTVFDQTVEIIESENTTVEFSLFSQADYENLATRNEVLVQGGTFVADRRTEFFDEDESGAAVTVSSYFYGQDLITVGELVEVYNKAIDEGIIYIDGNGIYLPQKSKPVLLLNMTPGLVGNRRRTILVEDGRLAVRQGFEGRPVNAVSWYGAAFYANSLSELEGLTPCYSLDDWSCSFSADGYRLPSEAELVFAVRSNEQIADYREESDWGDVDYLWTWDWYRSAVKLNEQNVNPLGPRSGLQNVGRGRDERDRNDPRFPKTDVGFRLVRSADIDKRIAGSVARSEISRNGIEPSFMLGMDGMDVMYWGLVGHYHRTVTNLYSFSAGLGFGVVPNGANNETMIVGGVTLTPVMIGNKERLAGGITFDIYFSFDGSDMGLGIPIMPTMSFQVYIRNVSIYFMPMGAIVSAMGATGMEEAFIIGAGYYFDL